jgi:perosamine synthetase
MKIQRSLPPAAAPFRWIDFIYALTGSISGRWAIEHFESELKRHFSVRHVFLVSSGKAALTLILLGLKSISSRKEVLIPAYTCFSVPSAIVKAGLKVAVCDLEPNGFDFHEQSLDGRIGDQTLCVVPNHLFGIPSRLDRLREICRKKGVFLVEDAAQAMGGHDGKRLIGTLGDVGFFSLGRGKNLTCGSGGVILTNSDEIAAAITREYSSLALPGLLETVKEFLQLMLMAIFLRPTLFWFPQGLRFLRLGETVFHKDFPMQRLSGMKAGFLRCWQVRLKRSNQMRAATSAFFSERLGLRLPAEGPLALLRFPLLLDGPDARRRLLSLSREKGLGLSAMYPTAVHQIAEIRSMFHGMSFPSAEAVAERLITIPTHPLLTRKDKEVIGALLDEFKTDGFESKVSSTQWTAGGSEMGGIRCMADRTAGAR